MDGGASIADVGGLSIAAFFATALLYMLRERFKADGEREDKRIAADNRTAEALAELARAVYGLTHHVTELRQDVGGITPPLGTPAAPPPPGRAPTAPAGPYSIVRDRQGR